VLCRAAQRWGCFHPLRDVAAPPFWAGQGKEPARTYGPGGSFDPAYIPPKLFFFAGEACLKAAGTAHAASPLY
jgi:hypothetical protein